MVEPSGAATSARLAPVGPGPTGAVVSPVSMIDPDGGAWHLQRRRAVDPPRRRDAANRAPASQEAFGSAGFGRGPQTADEGDAEVRRRGRAPGREAQQVTGMRTVADVGCPGAARGYGDHCVREAGSAGVVRGSQVDVLVEAARAAGRGHGGGAPLTSAPVAPPRPAAPRPLRTGARAPVTVSWANRWAARWGRGGTSSRSTTPGGRWSGGGDVGIDDPGAARGAGHRSRAARATSQ